MNTDPFTTADNRWDESPHHLADHCDHAGVGKACRRCRRKFDASARWARAHLAAQKPSLIDRMLAVMPEDARAHWDTMDDERQRWGGGVCRCYLCDALIAARSVGRDAR